VQGQQGSAGWRHTAVMITRRLAGSGKFGFGTGRYLPLKVLSQPEESREISKIKMLSQPDDSREISKIEMLSQPDESREISDIKMLQSAG